MDNKVFKTQKEYIRYLRWRRRFSQVITAVSVILVFLYIVITKPYNLSAWLVFCAYVLLMAILNYYDKRELLKKDKETASKDTQERLARENKKRINKQK